MTASLSRRSFLAASAVAATGLAGCTGDDPEDMTCTGDCEGVDQFGADEDGMFTPEVVFVTFTEPFSGRVTVRVRDHSGDVKDARQETVENRTVVRFEVNDVSNFGDVTWHLEGDR